MQKSRLGCWKWFSFREKRFRHPDLIFFQVAFPRSRGAGREAEKAQVGMPKIVFPSPKLFSAPQSELFHAAAQISGEGVAQVGVPKVVFFARKVFSAHHPELSQAAPQIGGRGSGDRTVSGFEAESGFLNAKSVFETLA